MAMCDNCLAILGLGCVCCCQFRCDAEKTRAALAFLPPSPPSYSVSLDAKDPSRGRMVYSEPELRESPIYMQAANASEVSWVTPRKGWQVPLVRVRRVARPAEGNSNVVDSGEPITLLHCHGNAADIGHMMGPYVELAFILGIDVVGVEYTGYGAAGGALHTSNMKTDIEAAYDAVLAMGVSPGRIVVYGQSIGSAPAVHLAARRPIGGLVLHSPLASALKVVDPRPDGLCRPSCAIGCFDVFRNDRQISSVECPVLIMHGELDDVVPLHNAELLHRRLREGARWPQYFVPDAGHNDLVEADPPAYFGQLESFVAFVQRRARGETDLLPAPLMKKPGQAKMADTVVGRPASSGAVEAVEAIEATGRVAKAGPEDGRYEKLRHPGLPGSAAAEAIA